MNRLVRLIVAALLLPAGVLMAQPATQPATQPARGAAAGAGFLGAKLATMDDRIAEETGSDATEGVFVAEVMTGTPAEAGGLQDHDVIRKLDDTEVKALPDLQKFMSTTKPGQVVTVTVTRAKETQELKITLGQRPGNLPPPTTRPG